MSKKGSKRLIYTQKTDYERKVKGEKMSDERHIKEYRRGDVIKTIPYPERERGTRKKSHRVQLTVSEKIYNMLLEEAEEREMRPTTLAGMLLSTAIKKERRERRNVFNDGF